eukprot:TRINITY_DN3310_c0_g1_i3.p2 TRINITY_DN3310_c0_g1~~TRINITY_DN3310_c0_g1_i3.p2  ORF type:complete len:294 (+),score=55.63 TRINITY_DN3310_c0_g1_i3:1113-1994(+)
MMYTDVFNQVIRSYAAVGEWQKIERLMAKMTEQHSEPDSLTYAALMQAYAVASEAAEDFYGLIVMRDRALQLVQQLSFDKKEIGKDVAIYLQRCLVGPEKFPVPVTPSWIMSAMSYWQLVFSPKYKMLEAANKEAKLHMKVIGIPDGKNRWLQITESGQLLSLVCSSRVGRGDLDDLSEAELTAEAVMVASMVQIPPVNQLPPLGQPSSATRPSALTQQAAALLTSATAAALSKQTTAKPVQPIRKPLILSEPKPLPARRTLQLTIARSSQPGDIWRLQQEQARQNQTLKIRA